MKNILVPVDGSPASLNAVDKAVELAKALDSRITLITVMDVPSDGVSPNLAMNNDLSTTREKTIKTKVDHLSKMLRDIELEKKAAGVDFAKEVLYGNHHDKIVEYAKADKTDLIVMGHRGFGAVKRLLIGSVAQRVMETAPCSVLIVKEL